MRILVDEMPKEAKECYFSVFVNGQYRCITKKLLKCNLKRNRCRLLKEFKPVKDDCK